MNKDVVTISRYEYNKLLSDSERLDWIEAEAKASRTGLTVMHIKNDGERPAEHGYRLMRFHRQFCGQPTLRDAVDFAKGDC